MDTNVVSEVMRHEPRPGVLVWIDQRASRELFVTAVTEAEILAGIALLQPGRRRRRLAGAAERTFSNLFPGRVLPFDSPAARAYSEIVASRRAAGRPASLADSQIAAVARSRGMAVATRNVRDFVAMGVEIFNPWSVT
ncbi:MAG: type II toxin-antitoxin system VapC family toxin [Bryobacterales bacterium]|nr:type II toxin-antitoxin system VapC family toxin [Bryobacterales bacterium]